MSDTKFCVIAPDGDKLRVRMIWAADPQEAYRQYIADFCGGRDTDLIISLEVPRKALFMHPQIMVHTVEERLNDEP